MSRTPTRPPLTEADRDSQTRFGIRPVPKGHRTASPYPHRKMVSSKVPPSGKVSPDGRRVWPQPSLTARIVVWGGLAAGVAGLTAAGAIAVRKLTEPDRPQSGDGRLADRAHVSPRFSALEEDEREEMRRRVRAQARDDARAKAEMRARASRGRKGSGNPARDLTQTASDLAAGLNGVVAAITSAFDAFQRIARQGRGVVSEFSATADEIRAMAGPRPVSARPNEGRHKPTGAVNNRNMD